MAKIKDHIESFIKNRPILGDILAWSKRKSLPGFEGVPLYYVVAFIVSETQKDDITTRANSIAFSFFLAIFPGIIFLFTLLPIMPFSDYYASTLQIAIASALPLNASTYLSNIINGVTEVMRGGLLSVGFIFSMFFASSGVLTLMFGFDKKYDQTFRHRGYFQKRGVALLLTLLIIAMFFVSVLFVIIGESALVYLLHKLGFSDLSFMITALRYIIAIGVIYSGISLIYRYGPSMYKRTPFFNAGSLLATILSILTSLGFAFFINNFGRYNELYGSIGALIVILLWLQFNAFILLLGFELNAAIAVNRDTLDLESQVGESYPNLR